MTSVAEKTQPAPTSRRATPRILPPRARRILPLCAAVLFGLAVHRLWVADPEPRPYAELRGHTMGTTWSVKVAREPFDDASRMMLLRAIDDELDRLNARMSTYIETSELSRFNAFDSRSPFPVSQQTIEVFEIAQAVSRDTGGAFDVTVGPLVAAWGFGASNRPPSPPSDEDLRVLIERVGYAKVAVDPEQRTLRKTNPGVSCDLSAVAKGYGVDRIAAILEGRGYRDFLVEIGGELRAAGTRLDGRVWRVGVERPDAVARTSHGVVVLPVVALATSGDYRDFYEIDEQRISHTIDPRTGRPINHRLASVSVLHREAAWADALATALNVMGPQEGFRWAQERNLAALLLVREGDGEFHELATAAWPSRQSASAQPAPLLD